MRIYLCWGLKKMTDIIKCPYCGEEIDFDQLDDERVIGEYEYRGECHGVPCSEYTVYGCICPNCDRKIEF